MRALHRDASDLVAGEPFLSRAPGRIGKKHTEPMARECEAGALEPAAQAGPGLVAPSPPPAGKEERGQSPTAPPRGPRSEMAAPRIFEHLVFGEGDVPFYRFAPGLKEEVERTRKLRVMVRLKDQITARPASEPVS